MSNQNFENLVASPSVEMNPSRPQQRGRLLLLPTEILLQITTEILLQMTGEPGRDGGTMTYKDLKRLALSCSRLFHLIRPMYYFADDYAVFHSAVAHRDLDFIQRYIQFRAAPQMSSVWSIRHLMWLYDRTAQRTFLGSCLRSISGADYLNAACSDRPYEVGSWVGFSWSRPNGWWRLRTNIGNVAWGLFLGIMDASMTWKESYLGEVTHGFQEKIQLLMNYEAVDSDELLALQCLLETLKGITSDAQELGGFDEERDGKACWLRLCEAKPKFRADMSASWMQEYGWDLKQNEKGMWYDHIWDHFQNFERTLLTLPEWQPANFDEYVALVEKEYLEVKAAVLPWLVIVRTLKKKATMSNHHIEDFPLSSSSKQMTSSRPQPQGKPAQQEGRLALLPVEVLLNITGEPGKDEQTLSHKDFKSLVLSSGMFFRELRQAYYCADNFAVFHSALRCVDMEVMERCYNLAKPPTDLTWEVSCKCPSEEPHKQHRPIDDVLECLAIGSAPIDRCIEAIRWLLSKGYEANEQKDQAWYRSNQHCNHMPELIIELLGKTSGKAHVEGIYEIITMLHNHGYSLPYRLNLHKFSKRWYDQLAKPGLIRKPMDVALRSHCPMSFLELILHEYQRRGANAVVAYRGCPLEMRTWVGTWRRWGSDHWELPLWRQSTNFGNVLWGLFLDIADPSTSWKESYQGEAADIFEKKLQLLIDYQFVQLQEIQVLRRLVTTLRENPLDCRLISDDKDGKEYWETLCASLGPFMENEGLVKDDRLLGYKRVWGRLHRFVIETSWNPWTVWHDYKMQDPKHRAKLWHPWTNLCRWGGIQSRHGTWFDPEWHHLAEYEDEHDAIIGEKRDKHSLPNWNTVNYDEFVAAVEELWRLTHSSRLS
ncbi:hypothetical protein FPCIR_14042 [Fusarium pseudocircinatum]|uniref:Uncharacterized protein n=1 Tax=Fusarium pseudocircinatum TaxID=56676 RepID=A0A8H5KHA4_9HYPO|nr:hypothetical protein FPCIR_14042 [Fusarium pseudocircinatum]